MKTIFIFIGIVAIFGCTNPTAKSKGSVKNEFGVSISPAAVEAIDTLKQVMSIFCSSVSRGSAVPNFEALFEMDSSNTVLLPYYQLDAEAFYENPSPEGIVRNLSPSEDLYIALKGDGDIKASFIAHQVGNFWEMDNYMSNRSTLIAWLPQVLNDADNREYKIFRLGGLEIFVFTMDGETVFYDSLGKKYSGGALCEELVSMLNLMKRNQEYIRKRFPDKAKPTEL